MMLKVLGRTLLMNLLSIWTRMALTKVVRSMILVLNNDAFSKMLFKKIWSLVFCGGLCYSLIDSSLLRWFSLNMQNEEDMAAIANSFLLTSSSIIFLWVDMVYEYEYPWEDCGICNMSLQTPCFSLLSHNSFLYYVLLDKYSVVVIDCSFSVLLSSFCIMYHKVIDTSMKWKRNPGRIVRCIIFRFRYVSGIYLRDSLTLE